MYNVKVLKTAVKYITETNDAIKIVLNKKKENSDKDVCLVCKKEYGIKEINEYYYAVFADKKKINRNRLYSIYKQGKYYVLSLDVFTFENKHTENDDELYKRIAVVYNKFYNIGYSIDKKSYKYNHWFCEILQDNSLISSAPHGYTIGHNFCYFTTKTKRQAEEVAEQLLDIYCKYYDIILEDK